MYGTMLPANPLIRIASSVSATFPMFYGICTEEHTCEAILPQYKRKCDTKIGNIGDKGNTGTSRMVTLGWPVMASTPLGPQHRDEACDKGRVTA